MASPLATRLNDGNAMATEVVSNILNSLVEQPFQDVEEACMNYLKQNNCNAVIEEFESKRVAHKKSDRHVIEILTHHTSLTANQAKNQSLRFGLEENSTNQRQSWGFGSKNMFCGVMGSSSAVESRDYEEVTSPEIINAPITDICIIQRGDPIPPGFYRLSRTTTMKKANLNTSSGGNNIYFCIKKDPDAPHSVTAIMLFFPDKNEFIPPDFVPVRRGQRPCNINAGTSFERIFIGYKKEAVGNFITDMNVIFPNKGEEPPKGFNLLDRSPTGIPANLNTGSAGVKIYLCYKQKLARIACLNQEVSRRGSLRSMSSTLPTPTLSMLTLNTTTPPLVPDGSAEQVENDGTTIDVNDLELDASETAADDLEYSDVVYHEDQDINLFANAIVVYNDGRIVNSLSRKALFAILSALFIRREGPAIIALQGLTRLLKESNFFESDLKSPHQSGCVTMLDVTVDALCDRFEDCVESEFDAVLQFIRILTRHAACKFSTMAVQKFFKAFHFLSRYYSSRHPFRSGTVNMPTNENGSELLVFKVFREFIYNTQGIVENVPVEHFLPSEEGVEDEIRPANLKENEKLIGDLTRALVNDVIESMEISRISENCLVLLSKHSMSPLLSVFWQNISGYSKLLFVDSSYRSTFVLLCAICKQAWLTPRPCSTGTNVREVGAKLLALEALYEFCISAGEKMRLSKTMGYAIRRLVVPCVLFNVAFAFEDHRIFSKLLKIITALWKVWRAHCRIEFAILCEHLVIQVLQAPQSKIKPLYQRLVLEEVVLWFDQPHLLLEMFVNYDIDRKFVSQWNIFSYLVRAVCTIARRAATIDWSSDTSSGKNSSRQPSSPSHHQIEASGAGAASTMQVSSHELSLNALEQVCRIAKTIMDASGHAHLMLKDSKFRSLSLSTGKGWEENADHNDEGMVSGVKLLRADHQQAEEIVKEAFKIYKEKDSIKKAVAFLVSKGFMADTPQDITSFLRAYKTSFDPTAIGDYLGEGGITPAEINYWTQIRFRYVRAVSFVGLEVETALRLFLTGCGFRLPGESQKIDRLVETFVKAYWQDNHGTSLCSFQAPDTIHILSFAMIMLNTDLHVANTKRKQRRMTKDEFSNNLRGVDSGLSPEYLGTIYDNIAANRIEMPFQTPVKSTANNNNNNNSSNSNNSSNNSNNNSNNSEGKTNPAEEREFAKSISRELRNAEDLLRSLSKYTFGFQVTGVDTNISLDLVSFMYETVWYLFHAITEALLTTPVKDINVTFAALDILSYSLTSSIFLNLQVEKMSIATQLKNFREGYESSGSQSSRPTITDDSWFTDVETSTSATAMETIPKVLKLMVRLKDSIQQAQNYELTRKVAARIERKANILDQNTYFVREGDLWKRSANGRLICYRFFLFSDYLIYAHHSITGEYRVHEQMQLTQMSVSDVEDDATNCSFYIDHPVKSFVVVADSTDTKYAWIRDIHQTTAACRNREAQMNNNSNRKMSIIGRIEGQQEEQLNRLSKRITSSPQAAATTEAAPTSGGSSTPIKTIQQESSGDVSPANK